MIKIFHIADLHLDSPFSLGEIRRSEQGRGRLCEVFRRMMRHVRNEKYDLVLIAGDLYENGFITEETAALIKSEFELLPCPVVISPGNHDPYIRGSLYSSCDFSGNVHIFSSENIEKIDFDNLGVSVYGYAFTGSIYRSNPLGGLVTDSSKINLLCAHTELNSPLSPYAPMSEGDIEQAGFTYAALGHIHKAPQPRNEEGFAVAYSGFAEGRAFDEIGKGGALSVSIFETGARPEIKIEKLSFSGYSFEILRQNVSYMRSEDEIAEAVQSSISQKGYGVNTALRVILEGQIDMDFAPNTALIERRLSAFVDYAEVRDNTLPIASGEALRKDSTIRGELYRTLEERMLSGNEDERRLAGKALRIGLAALEGRDISSFFEGSAKDEKEEGEA